MEEIKNIIDDIGIAALETNIKIAALAVLSDSGNLIYQTENWNLSNQANILLNVLKGERSFTLSDVKYSVVETNSDGIIGTNDLGMGHIILAPFKGGVLVSYAMSQADPVNALSLLKSFTIKLTGKL